MNKTTLLLDVSNLSHRNFHALRGVSKYKTPTVYGLLRDLTSLGRVFDVDQFVFCFDCVGPSIRSQILTTYKGGRQDSPDKRQVREEIRVLKEEVLPDMGYSNLFCVEGAEADDVIAFACREVGEGEQYVIVSSDTDLYQLLTGRRVVMWNPLVKCEVSEESVWAKYNIHPHEWALYKAIMGCATDEIPGIPTIGPTTAQVHMRVGLPATSKAYGRIMSEQGKEIIERNVKLTKLPCPLLENPKLRITTDSVTEGTWDMVVYKFGLEVLIGKFPGI